LQGEEFLIYFNDRINQLFPILNGPRTPGGARLIFALSLCHSREDRGRPQEELEANL